MTLNSQLIPINSHNFQIFNISKIPELNFPWKLTGKFWEMNHPFATLLTISSVAGA